MGSAPYLSRILFSCVGPGRRRQDGTVCHPIWAGKRNRDETPHAVGHGVPRPMVCILEAAQRALREGASLPRGGGGRAHVGFCRDVAAGKASEREDLAKRRLFAAQ